MSRVFTVYKVSSIGLHSEIKAVRFASCNLNVCGGFIECAGWLECCILVNRDANGVIVSSIDWCSEDKWHSN